MNQDDLLRKLLGSGAIRVIPKHVIERQKNSVLKVLEKYFDQDDEIVLDLEQVAIDCVYATHFETPDDDDPKIISS